MSDRALEIYEEERKLQENRTTARRIRTRVYLARKNPHTAGLRWPFELLQNAIDAGPRIGTTQVTVALRHEAQSVVFEHDGAPFSSKELAALLSGGSSKEFESEDMTGRFGTGFLVTHVLAVRTNIQGLFATGTDQERFRLVLDRGGDDDAILTNIFSCSRAIREATALQSIDGEPSARFEYIIDHAETFALGLESFRQSLPYLYATRSTLGQVTIRTHDGEVEVWTPSPVEFDDESKCISRRNIAVNMNGSIQSTELRVFRFMAQPDAHAAALVLLRKEPSGWQVIIPEPDRPRVYREYPLRGSGFLPVNFILDGKFDPDEERARLLMGDGDKRLVQEALNGAVVGVLRAITDRWGNAHLLARARAPMSGFDPTDAKEIPWWTSQLASFATRVATMPIVDTGDQMLPAIDENGFVVDFVIPRLSTSSSSDETTVERVWPLVKATENLIPPRLDIATDWTVTADGWAELGLDLHQITLSDLADEVRPVKPLLQQLAVVGDKREWLAKWIDVIGECWKACGVHDASILEGLLPDQLGFLRSPKLRRDIGVPNELKQICEAMKLKVRSTLLDLELKRCGEALGLNYLIPALSATVEETANETDIVDECLEHLDDKLPDNNEYEATDEIYLQGSIKLLAFLFRSQGKAAESAAKRCPLVTSSNDIVRWSRERMLMAPASSWPLSAQPFSNVYPMDRILAGNYVGTADNALPSVTAALVAWGVAYADPITSNTPSELKERRLAAIAEDKTQASGVTVTGGQFSQIALLHPELINRCRVGFDEARALLGLVLCHVAPNDPGWKESRTVIGRKGGKEVALKVRGALWLADLLFQAWVPIQDADGKVNQMTANASTLKDLLCPSWFNDSAIELLSVWFGFDELELRLLGTAPNAEQRQELRNGLARLVESAGADPRVYEALVLEMAARRKRERDVARCRKFGLAIQEAIRQALVARDLTLTLIDKGYDFEVLPPSEDVLTGAVCRIEVGPYLLEIKATTTGQARMTPMQAITASAEAERYVLCVVDLRTIADARLDGEWVGTDVEPLAVMVSGIGNDVAETCQYIEMARNSEVSIRNEDALRYEVPVEVWERGASIKEWVDRLSASSALSLTPHSVPSKPTSPS